ncbi:UvrD-like helicase C-terminal domain-containing protein [Cyclonatronum proteinivorum]|uniref:UvrD-like helicase C-terminal domain-containing protein n=1 Tax=Cyclonatronum proteinivorum TaxID=1457365 RepID=A0A345UPP9_9BACT|nr:AAA family ATPase [Cyclonatronum proteinivorum]AXJ02451.1 UvrD-like helicase C-terminal domain-containing protein [Cyclonatronum proteinivorum]
MEDHKFTDIFDIRLTNAQGIGFQNLLSFLDEPQEKVFILKGYAGTGKTTLIRGLINYLKKQEKTVCLLASTGRAAKIAGDLTGAPASTIHSHLYKFTRLDKDLDELEKQELNPQTDQYGQIKMVFAAHESLLDPGAVYVIDESSMISDEPDDRTSFALFGSGKLLQDLIGHDPHGKFIFIGDPCQLPPANMPFSPALTKGYIEATYKVKAQEFELTQIVRQDANSGITKAASRLRELYFQNPQWRYGYLFLKGKKNVNLHTSHVSLLNAYIAQIEGDNFARATLIAQTNRHCKQINESIRRMLGRRSGRIEAGDLMMVTQNNYLVPLVNGDLVTIEAVGESTYRTGLQFTKVRVKPLNKEETYEVLLLEDVVYALGPNITTDQHKSLLIDFNRRMKALGLKQSQREFNDNMMADPYLNALRANFGYALTCHKSQGGEWDEVFLYLDNKIQGIPRPGLYQWWYTAVTRARKTLHAVDDWFVK